jgi:hypothetical protein
VTAPDAPAPGKWSQMVKPLADRFTLAGKFGCEVTLESDAARATGDALARLADMLDQDATVHAAMLDRIAQLQADLGRRLTRELVVLGCGWVVLLLTIGMTA